MFNIVSIDFDIIMGPSIEAYNSYANKPWEEKIEDAGILEYCICDTSIYQKLTNYLISLTKNLSKEKIHIIRDHHHILNFLPEKETLQIFNIDHHHDIGYNEKDENELNCGNWGKYLKDQNPDNQIIWINNFNSKEPMPGKENFLTRTTPILSCSLENITPDELILCLSPEWVPPRYQTLFFLWLDLLNIIYNTHFDFED